MPEQNALSGLSLRGRTLPTYIAIEGPIGVGKTTLARRIAGTFDYDLLLEEAEVNPFLERFYQDRQQTALATQLFFLFQRVQKITELKQRDMFDQARVADFVLEKDPLFARVNLDLDEYALYQKVFEKMRIDAPVPDLVIYLQASSDRLLERIERRGIDAERGLIETTLSNSTRCTASSFSTTIQRLCSSSMLMRLTLHRVTGIMSSLLTTC